MNLIKKVTILIVFLFKKEFVIGCFPRSKNFFFTKEFDKVWVHGLLHLIGYDHVKNKDYFKMNKIEKKILNSIN